MRSLILLLVAVMVLASCQKEVSIDSLGGSGGGGGSSSGSLIGTWKFIGMSAITESAITVTDAGIELKSLTISSYTTKNNTGTYTFTSNKIIVNGLGYSVDDSALGILSQDGQIVDSIEFPFTFTLPPTNGESTYRKVGADSLAFETGSLGIPNYGTQPTQANGVKYKFSGDTLFLVSKFRQSNTVVDAGAVQKIDNFVDAVIELLK